ncbi:hypothetical protein ACOSQ4_027680 [Xanthoceras sorbifolium]
MESKRDDRETNKKRDTRRPVVRKTTREDRRQGKLEVETDSEEDVLSRRDRLGTRLTKTIVDGAPKLAGCWLNEAVQRRSHWPNPTPISLSQRTHCRKLVTAVSLSPP